MGPAAPDPEAGEAHLLLRPGTPDDAAVLAELFIAAREAAYPAIPRSIHPPHEVHAWFRDLLALEQGAGNRGGREAWVAEGGSVVVGYLILDPEWLDSLYARPDLTGHGIGSTLLELAKGLRPDGFALWVFETNVRARGFYLRHGLVEAERTDGSENEEKAPDIRMVWPGTDPLAYLRRQVDAVDTELGKVLARRAALTAAIQKFKQVPGHQGRDLAREAEIAGRLAEHAPNLGPDRIERILHVVITESLDAAEPREDPCG